jgi:hypothetical protein
MQKALLLAIFTLLLFCQPAKAENITIEKAFQLFRSQDLIESTVATALARGVVDNAYFMAEIINKDKEQVKCVIKPPQVWAEFVFDDYKNGKVDGNMSFSFTLSAFIYSKCFKQQ